MIDIDEITEDNVKEWCYRRNLVVITREFYHHLTKNMGSECRLHKIVKCKDCIMHGVCRYELGLGKDGFCSQGKAKEK